MRIIIIVFDRTGRVEELVFFHRFLNFFVGGYFCESLLIDCLGGFFLLNDSKNTIIKMLIEVLRIAESYGTSGTFACGVGAVVCAAFGGAVGTASATVWWGLFDAVDGG